MTALTADQIWTLSEEFWRVFVVFLRVAAIVSLAPAFGEQSIPVRVKLALALSFTLVVSPAVAPVSSPANFFQFLVLGGVETIIGIGLGIGLRLLVMALQIAGSIAAQATSLSQLLGAAASEPVPAMGYLLVISGLTLAVTLGLHVRLAEFLILTYSLFPAGTLPNAADLGHWGVRQVSRVFALAFALAAPFAIASLIYNLTLGVINRAMPQLMVAFVGAPAITFGGMAILLLGAPILLAVWVDALWAFMRFPLDPGP